MFSVYMIYRAIRCAERLLFTHILYTISRMSLYAHIVYCYSSMEMSLERLSKFKYFGQNIPIKNSRTVVFIYIQSTEIVKPS
jgi:hypothetical protein